MMKPARAFFLALVIVSACSAGAAIPGGPQFHLVKYPGAYETVLSGVSDNEIVCGTYFDAEGVQHGFIEKNDKFETVDAPLGYGTTSVLGVNSSGTAVGYYFYEEFYYGFSYSKGVFTSVGPSGSSFTYAYGINDAGIIVGAFRDTDGILKGWIFDGASYQTVVVPGSLESSLSGINAQGVSTAQWEDQLGNWQSSTYNGSTFTEINVPGAVESYAFGIDSFGDVVYGWSYGPGPYYAAALVNGKYTKFDVPGCNSYTSANGINDHHVIVGSCQLGGGFVGYYVVLLRTGIG